MGAGVMPALLYFARAYVKNRDHLKYWLALSKIKGIATPDARAAILGIGDVKNLFERRRPGLRLGESSGILEKAAAFSDWDWVEKERDLVEKNNVVLITLTDDSYPALLRHIYDAPYVLYSKGVLTGESSGISIAVVGTRRASTYGLSMAEAISRDLASAGIVIVSGMARGCDSAAHRGALSASGKTIAVLGSGIDIAYPSENRRLYEEISQKGLLLSEFPMGAPPLAMNFPRRNRIIGGISRGVVVAEAPLRSGAVMTAHLALEYGKEVFALPGQARSKTSEGTNKLIKEGASLIDNATDVIEALFPEKKIPTNVPGRVSAKDVKAEGKEEGLIFKLLDDGPMHIDSIAERAGLPVQQISIVLLAMELKGLVCQKPGKLYENKG